MEDTQLAPFNIFCMQIPTRTASGVDFSATGSCSGVASSSPAKFRVAAGSADLSVSDSPCTAHPSLAGTFPKFGLFLCGFAVPCSALRSWREATLDASALEAFLPVPGATGHLASLWPSPPQ
eukprot:362536-Chlamydomonas_euryale.AAC.9